MEEVPARTVIGKTEYATWKDVAPVIARMRTDARQHFAATGAKGGRELSSYSAITAEGADVLVGMYGVGLDAVGCMYVLYIIAGLVSGSMCGHGNPVNNADTNRKRVQDPLLGASILLPQRSYSLTRR